MSTGPPGQEQSVAARGAHSGAPPLGQYSAAVSRFPDSTGRKAALADVTSRRPWLSPSGPVF